MYICWEAFIFSFNDCLNSIAMITCKNGVSQGEQMRCEVLVYIVPTFLSQQMNNFCSGKKWPTYVGIWAMYFCNLQKTAHNKQFPNRQKFAQSGVDVMYDHNFLRFRHFWAKQWRFSQKQGYDQNFP
jgi:hypothetical protein